jgi:hypothetical protein
MRWHEFEITSSTGKYKVMMRGAYQHSIRTEKQLRTAITHAIQNKIETGQPEYAACLQKKLDNNKILDICSLFGIVSKTTKI